VRIALALLTLVLAAYAVQLTFGLGGQPAADFSAKWIYTLLAVGASGVCLIRVLVRRQERLAWTCFLVGLTSWALGEVMWIFVLARYDDPAFALVLTTDVLYLTMYPAYYCGLILLMRARLRPFRASLWLDGVAGGLAVAALGAALVLGTVLQDVSGSTYDVVIALAYPLGDLLVVVVAVAAIGMTGWRPGSAWALIALAVSVGAVADTVYLYRTALGTWEDGTLIDLAWSLAMLLTAVAAWRPQPRRAEAAYPGLRTVLLPAVFTLTSLGVLVYGSFAETSPGAIALATAGLLVSFARAGLTYLENSRMLRRREEQAMTDGLSGLPNRRQLMLDLEDATDDADHPATLLFFDLNGFKQYNDTFGHNAGDALLARLGAGLADALGDAGRAYRLGGDEFCALIEGRHSSGEMLVKTAVAALSETGSGFTVSASYGVVVLPDEAATPNEALGLADERMYSHKRRAGRFSSRQQARSVLLQVQSEREPDVHTHASSVADLTSMVGSRLGLDSERMDVLTRAAELHDIGKVAIPEEILHKPGPLTDGEWAFVRQHTVIGERILAAAPALAPVGRIVRASHERWDGTGYPDMLAGDDIPLEARIVGVCDAFDAMVSDRPYRAGMTVEEAVAELGSCAGSQFDPAVVGAFVDAVRAGELERDDESGRRSSQAA
jgi:two-component system, cell cycle response regulator